MLEKIRLARTSSGGNVSIYGLPTLAVERYRVLTYQLGFTVAPGKRSPAGYAGDRLLIERVSSERFSIRSFWETVN